MSITRLQRLLLPYCALFVLSSINVLLADAQSPQAIAKLEPADGRIYHGVGQAGTGVNEYISALADSSIHPIVVKWYYDIPGSRGNKFTELRQTLAKDKAIGRIPELSIAFSDGKSATDSSIAASTRYDNLIDSLALICKEFGRAMFVRPGFEFNGSWNGYHPYLYPQAFRKVVERFRSMNAADSVAFEWCYYAGGNAPNDFDSVDSRGARWYPGDSYVDWFALDVFNAADFHPDSASTSRRGVLTTKGKSERFLSMAQSKSKPVMLSETTAQGMNISNDQQDSMHDWTSWFAPFFRFISNHPHIKGFNYINWDWTKYPQWASWGDARIENSPYILQAYKQEIKKSKYIHLPYKQVSASAPTIPLTELDTIKWKGYEGGLYPNHSNTRPATHNADGISIAGQIKALASDGSPDEANGKIVLLSIGMSNTTQEFSAFISAANADTMKNPQVILVDGAQGGQTASIIQDASANFWTVVSQRLQQAGVSAAQVQAVWLKEANAAPTQAFPLHAQMLKQNLKNIVRLLKRQFPQLQLCYLSSRIYAGYATTTLNPEPYAYESGFSVKWLIEEQMNGDDSLRYGGTRAAAPWIAWGPYLWAAGATPRKDNNVVWLQTDFQADGTHPSSSGQRKVANMLLDFFKTDATTMPWFLKKATTTDVTPNNDEQSRLLIFPNPSNGKSWLLFSTQEIQPADVTISDALGRKQAHMNISAEVGSNRIELPFLSAGFYLLRLQMGATIIGRCFIVE